MKKNIITTLLLILILFFGSCTKKTEPIPSPNPNRFNEINPLSVGNFWTIQLTVFDTLGNIYGAPFLSISKIIKDTIINNETCYVQTSSSDDYSYHDYFINKSDGYYNLFFNRNIQFENFLYAKYPVKIGDKFKKVNTEFIVESLDTLITVKAGTFKCIKYSFISINIYGKIISEDFLYYSLGYGFIKEELFSDYHSQNLYKYSSEELQDYKIY